MRATVLLAALAALEGIFIVFLLTTDGTEPPPPEPPPAEREAPDSATPADPAVDPREGGEPEPEPVSETRACVYGRLTGPDGGPPGERGWVWLRAPGERGRSAQMGPDGDYAQAGLEPGTYELKVRAQGYDAIETELIVPDGAEAIRRDFTLTKAVEIAIRFLTPEGNPLVPEVGKENRDLVFWVGRGLSAVATRESPGARLPGTLSSAWTTFGAGRYRVQEFGDPAQSDGRNGTLEIRAPFPVHVSACVRSEVLETVRLDGPRESLEFRIDPKRIEDLSSGVTFRLTGEGDPDAASKVGVSLNDRQTGGGGGKPERDGDRLTVRGKPPGQLLLAIWGGKAFERYERIVDLPPGTIVDLGMIHLTRRVELTGTVVDAEGNPVAGARISSYALDRPWTEQRSSPMGAVSKAEGRFTFWLGRRRYALRATSGDGAVAIAEADLTGGAPEAFRIVMRESHPVEVKAGDARLPCFARIEDRDGRVLTSRRFRSDWTWSPRIPEGSYSLVVTREGRESARRPFTVAAGKGPVSLTLD